MGLRRVFLLVDDAMNRWQWRQSWGGAKPSHTGCHAPHCHPSYPRCLGYGPVEACSAYDRDYWKKHPARPDYDGFAEYDADLEARWLEEFAHPKYPLPPGFPVDA
jgi:hypothetical protein